MVENKDAKKEVKKEKKSFKAYRPASKVCPKCGSRMAEHANRHACGRCGYTEWKEKA